MSQTMMSYRQHARAMLLLGFPLIGSHLAQAAVGLTDTQIRAVDALVTAWRGQGGVAVPGATPRTRLFAGRRDDMLLLYREPV